MKLTYWGQPHAYDDEMAVINDATDAFGLKNFDGYMKWLNENMSRRKRLSKIDSTVKKAK